MRVTALGVSAARTLAKSLADNRLDSTYRIVLIDRNSHANHLYVLPRLGVVPGHERKACELPPLRRAYLI
jgi:apoptosis-inducing factor 2